MNNTIYFEDLLANALIEKIEHGQGRTVSMSELKAYGERLVRWWEKNKNLQVYVADSLYDVYKTLSENPEFFEENFDTNRSESFFSLKWSKRADDLRAKFRSYLSVDMYLCFTQSFDGEGAVHHA